MAARSLLPPGVWQAHVLATVPRWRARATATMRAATRQRLKLHLINHGHARAAAPFPRRLVRGAASGTDKPQWQDHLEGRAAEKQQKTSDLREKLKKAAEDEMEQILKEVRCTRCCCFLCVTGHPLSKSRR